MTFGRIDDENQTDTDLEGKSDVGATSISESETESISAKKEQERVESLEKLQGSSSSTVKTTSDSPSKQRHLKRHLRRGKRRSQSVDAVIVLKEEKASVFQDFLKHAYPQ